MTKDSAAPPESNPQAFKNKGEKPFIITISGDLGSGKSVLADALVTAWGADRYSTGVVQRQLAAELGITTLELNKRAEIDKSIDDLIDSVFRSLADTPRNLVVDSRMAFHFLPGSFRIKLEVHPKVAALRVKDDTARVGEGRFDTLEAIESALIARKASERERFKRYYNADIEDHVGYDLVINTAATPREAVFAVVDHCVRRWRAGEPTHKLWVSPRHLYGACAPDQLDQDRVAALKNTWPALDGWAHPAVRAAKAGPLYIVSEGVDYVAAGLEKKAALIPVSLTGQSVEPPLPAITEAWEKRYNYKHLS